MPALYWVPHECTEAHISNFSIKTFYNFYCTLVNLVEQIILKKDLDEGKEICFDLLQNSQGNTINSRQKNYSAKKSQHAAKENEFTPEQRKTRPQKKKTWQIHWEPVMQVILNQFLCELWQFVI